LAKLAVDENDRIKAFLDSTVGKEEMINIRENHENKRLRFVVLDEDNIPQTFKTPEKYIQKLQPGFMKALSPNGRAHFYAPSKRLGKVEIDTFRFNLMVIWIVSLLLYMAIYYKFLQKLIYYIGNLRIQKSET
jgi:hypothetical protein